MTELKNVERELSRFRLRLIAAAAFVLVAFGWIAPIYEDLMKRLAR